VCGICGIAVAGTANPGAVATMSDALRHRGPDAHGRTAVGPVVLDARRLAIIDLEHGDQPIATEEGAVTVAQNGEIYNHAELRRELEARGHAFRSHTDTEVVVHAYEEWGEECFHRFNGMWALALWDARRRLLVCCRDRYGIKPLVFAQTPRAFAFASEIKALLTLGLVEPAANDTVVYDYLAHGFVDRTADTFFRGVQSLPAGHLLRVTAGGEATPVRWYEVPVGKESAAGAEERFAELFSDATHLRLVSDVPVGTCLSGGLDSTAIVCTVAELMRGGATLGGASVQKTFSARYPDDPSVDEGRYIAVVARESGAETHDVVPSGSELVTDLDRLLWHQEEPFGSTSIYAQWCVYRLARAEGVTVTLDGQGGDEVVGGYPQQLSPFLTQLVRSGRLRDWRREAGANASAVALARTALRAGLWSLPGAVQRPLQQAKALRRYPDWLNRRSEVAPRYASTLATTRAGDKFAAQMLHDLTVGLPALLRYADRNSMAHSIEARLPFLDHRLVELCFSLPPETRIENGRTKALLRNALRDRIPGEVLARRDKIGFATPESEWLRDLIPDVLSSRSFAERGYVKPERLAPLLQANERGDVAATGALWRCVNLELWLRRFVDRSATQAAPPAALLHA
jgi:asparagine synthase (glutamine-hydrolysing)